MSNKSSGQAIGEYIRVSARVRPMSPGSDDVQAVFPDELNNAVALRINNDEKRFPFDNVFGECSSQESVFINVGKRIIDGFCEGYNGTIFAYGQTGSGKTFTMLGAQRENGNFKKDLQGLIPRCMDYLFDVLSEKQEEGGNLFQFSVTCSFVQLYNEVFYDLLDNTTTRLRLRTTPDIEIDGATKESIESPKEIMDVLSTGYKNRRTAETKMNMESSRSHAIFILHLVTVISSEEGITNRRYSRLHLVDLAGSERQSDSLSTGDHLKEAGHINKSLSTLGRVIRTLSKQNSTYPGYRDSQLTHLLKDSLGGNSRTAVVINLHPNLKYSETTVSSLYFSSAVKQIRNKAVVNEKVSGECVDSLKNEILRLKEVVRSQQAEIVELNAGMCRLPHAVLTGENDAQMPDGPSRKRPKIESRPFTPKQPLLSQENAEEGHDHQKETFSAPIQVLNCVQQSKVAELEGVIEAYKTSLSNKENEIRQYEGSLSYKAHRVDTLRNTLEEVTAKSKELEDENEGLRRDFQIQKVAFEREKLEKQMKIQREARQELEACKVEVEELKRQRDSANEELAAVAGHHNNKQKINYVNQLREKIAKLEDENAEIKSKLQSARESVPRKSVRIQKQKRISRSNDR